MKGQIFEIKYRMIFFTRIYEKIILKFSIISLARPSIILLVVRKTFGINKKLLNVAFQNTIGIVEKLYCISYLYT
jgi:hypothetical protein